MNTVMSSQNHAMKTNTVKTSTKKLRKVKPSLTNSIAILHVSDAQNGRGPVIAQLQLPNYPDGQDDVLRDTVKALDCFEDTIDLAVLVRPRARRTAGTGFRGMAFCLPDIVGMIGAAPAQTKGPGFVYRGGLAQNSQPGKRNVSVLRTCDRFAFFASTPGGSDAGGLPTRGRNRPAGSASGPHGDRG